MYHLDLKEVTMELLNSKQSDYFCIGDIQIVDLFFIWKTFLE